MRKRISLFVALCSVFLTYGQFGGAQQQGQIFDPISWSASVQQENDSIYILSFKAALEEGWHLPSQREEAVGPRPTRFVFNDTISAYELVGKTVEPEGIVAKDEIFDAVLKSFHKDVTFTQKIKVTDATQAIVIKVDFMVCDDMRCLPPDTHTFTINLSEKGAAAVKSGFQGELTTSDLAKTEALKLELKGADNLHFVKKEGDGYLTIFFLGFIGGLIALLTPCVFPMIPLTVSFFTKGAKNRKKGITNAILYGLFILLIYLLVSIPFHVLDSVSPEILNNISTNTWLNVVFFVIFIIFAFSFFGYFELTLPSSWSNRMDAKASSIGGIIGIFFMAFTLVLVSFSCTGPILGSLLGGSLSSDGGAMQLTVGMGGFGLALALPFALFALFPNWLNSLPKSGGWLNSVKVVLGFLEVGLAFKFLSNADLVNQWGLLKREVFIGIWIIVGIGLALYLFGLIRFPHDGPKKKLPVIRKILGAAVVVFVLYLTPGLTNTKYANLSIISGFPPPMFYSLYAAEGEGEHGAPLGLEAYHDFEEGMAAAKAQGKPVIIDFTGWACVNCRKMEENVWTDPKVFETLQNEYILISLYVDDKNELPKEEQFNFKRPDGTVKQIISIGDKWATFQTVNFKNNSQPFYVLIDEDNTLLTKPRGYTPDASEYAEWLKEGVKKYDATHP